MKPEVAGLVEHLSVMAQELSTDAVSSLAARLTPLPSAHELDPSRGSTPPVRVLLQRLKTLWADCPAVTGQMIAMAIQTAERTSDSVSKQETLELTWTGPKSHGMTVRRNDQALLEVIAGAEEELLLVSYVVYSVPGIAKALESALERGVETRLILEFHGSVEGGQKMDPWKALGELPSGVQVYEWPIDQRPFFPGTEKKGYIHAKCAVADRHIAFVSSANLTTYAMNVNLELGVLVRGGQVPSRITANFHELISDGTLQLRSPK